MIKKATNQENEEIKVFLFKLGISYKRAGELIYSPRKKPYNKAIISLVLSDSERFSEGYKARIKQKLWTLIKSKLKDG